MWSLLYREIYRFLKVYNQTLFAPAINALLLLAIFSLSLGKYIEGGDLSFIQFVGSGLILMAAMQNAFANSSSSFVMGKVLGNIIDYLMPPISAGEMVFAMVAGALIRGILVGIIVTCSVLIFTDLEFFNFFYITFHLIAACLFLSLLGMLCGIFSESFDQMSAITSYVITPLTFLSGTFYSIKQLPNFWYQVSQYNPFFYMLDGFRYGMIGHHDGNLMTGIIYISLINILCWIWVHYLIHKGYRIKN